MEEIWMYVQSILGSPWVLLGIGIVFVVGLAKKLIKLVLLAAALTVTWVVLQQLGISLPI